MIDRLISSLLVFILSLVPSGFNSINTKPLNQTSIIFAGDAMLGRSVMIASLDNNDPYYPFRKVSDFLQSADITFLNLENPIINDCKKHVGGFTFCTTLDIAKGLSFAGVDIVTLANNHSGNYGPEGLEETKKHLSKLGIKSVGYDNLEIIEKNGVKFGFLGFNYTFTTTNLGRDLELIKKSDPQVDILIVSPHWGDEYKAVANKFQQSAASKMIEAGADVIVGHHPHWVENYEEIEGVPVYYSLGNFIFDQMWSEETKKGLIVKMTFDLSEDSGGTNLVKREEFRTYTKNIGQPEIVKE